MLNNLKMKTTCQLRPHVFGPKGGLCFQVSQYYVLSSDGIQRLLMAMTLRFCVAHSMKPVKSRGNQHVLWLRLSKAKESMVSVLKEGKGYSMNFPIIVSLHKHLWWGTTKQVQMTYLQKMIFACIFSEREITFYYGRFDLYK